MITRFMQVMFSAAENNDEELTSQVANDIEDAKNQEEGGGVEDEEVSYVNLGSGKVLVIDKENGEATVAEQNEEDPEQYDLEGFESDEELEKYLHTLDGTELDPNYDAEITEDAIEDHDLEPAEDWEDDVMTIDEKSDAYLNGEDEDEEEEDEEEECEDGECENSASEKVYSFPYHYARIFSEVLEEDEPAIVGELKIEKADDDLLVITDLETGDKAQVSVDDEGEFVVDDVQKELSFSVTMTEDELALFSEALYGEEEEYMFSEDGLYDVTMTEDEVALFSDLLEDEDEYLFSDDEDEEDEDEDVEDEDEDEDEDEEYEDLDEFVEHKEVPESEDEYNPQYIVGIDPEEHVIVDAPVYTDEDAQELMDRLEDDGVENLQSFECPNEARDYAMELLGEAGVSDIEQVAEPKEHNFSDVTIYTTRYFADCTEYMFKLFSEAEEGETESQDDIEDAIESGKQVETESEIITPIDDETAVVMDKDNDEYTKVTLDGDEINSEKISEDEADDLIQEAEEAEEDVKKFSTVLRYFAEAEEQQMAAEQQQMPQQGIDENIDPETGNPIQPEEQMQGGVEAVEDKALAAVQSIQEAANQAVLAITEAKEAPAPGEEEDLKEAKFSTYMFSNTNDTLDAWFNSI